MKKILLAFVVLILVGIGIAFTQNFLKNNNNFLFTKAPTITIKDHAFKLTLADTQEKKEIGLSETSLLPENEGMLFPFEKDDYYPFWMKNMKIPIDIIYINGDEIVTIINNATPPENQNENLIIYNPESPSDKVLEINAGLSQKYNFNKGDKVKYENLGD